MKSDKNIFTKRSSWTFDKDIPKKFDKHINKSVPLYKEVQWLCNEVSDFYLKKDSIVYDIGCSTGIVLNQLAVRHKEKPKIKYYGIDIIKGMISYAKEYNNHKQIKFQNKNVLKMKFDKSDFIISMYTIQFIEPKHRQALINKIFRSLNWGGAFFFVEKVRSYDARTQDQITSMYESFKLKNGFAASEVFGKKNSLKGVLEPFSTKGNVDMLKRSGFKDISTISKFMCFECFLAIK